MSKNTIESRITGRQAAHELYDLIADCTDDKAFVEACIEELGRLCGLKEQEPIEPIKEFGNIKQLGATVMPFGQYAGQAFDDIPLDYLDWLCRSQEDFYKSLRAYLKHPQLESYRGHE